MQGFGSYIQSTTIDFSSLGENLSFNYRLHGRRKNNYSGRYVLCSILQSNRRTGSVCAAAADDALSTSVDFSFQLGSEVYRFLSFTVCILCKEAADEISGKDIVIASLMACPPINRLNGNCWSAAVKPKCATMHSDCLD